MNDDSLSAELLAELEALRALPDEMIDLSNIPEITVEEWAKGMSLREFIAERRRALREVA